MLCCVVAPRQAEGAESWAQMLLWHPNRLAGRHTAHLLRWHCGLLSRPHMELRLNTNAGLSVQDRCGSMPVMTAAVLLNSDCCYPVQPLIGGSCAELHLLHRVCPCSRLCICFSLFHEPGGCLGSHLHLCSLQCHQPLPKHCIGLLCRHRRPLLDTSTILSECLAGL